MPRDKGNNVDFSQRYADSEADGFMEQAESIAKTIRQQNPQWWIWHDPEANKRFIDGLRDNLAGIDTTPEEDARLRQESEEKPLLSRKADDEFWNSEEPQKVMPRKL